MKFRVTDLNIKVSPRYPYSHRIELIEYKFEEHDKLIQWIEEFKVPCCIVGTRSSVLYLNTRSLSLFLLKWS